MVVASDCGTVIYPLGAEGQVEGGLAQGIGYALTEGLQFDEGRPVNPNFADYRIPSMRDMPPLQHAFADSYEPTGPFGAKGLGELNMDPTAAVINNAIFDAVGVRVKTLPITPEKILRACGQGQVMIRFDYQNRPASRKRSPCSKNMATTPVPSLAAPRC
jgi:putative selenate reductase molybdopterin-binding subunit